MIQNDIFAIVLALTSIWGMQGRWSCAAFSASTHSFRSVHRRLVSPASSDSGYRNPNLVLLRPTFSSSSITRFARLFNKKESSVVGKFTNYHTTSLPKRSTALLASSGSSSSNDHEQAETSTETTDNYDATTQQQQHPQLSVAAASLNLIKAIVGSGVLALPAGVAAMSDYPKTLIPASILLLILGSLSAYTFGLYGRICHVHQAKTLGEAWEKEFGSSPWLLSLGLCLFCGGAALTYNIVMGDTFSSLARSLGMTGWCASRQASILVISSTTLLPLCSLSSLAALAPVSMLGVVGVLVTTLFMAWRCLAPTSPYRLLTTMKQLSVSSTATATGRNFLQSLSPQFYPKFNTYSKVMSPSALILAAMAATAFTGHFSAPDFYLSLRGTDDNNSSNNNTSKTAMQKYFRVTAISFASVALINVLILSFGFLTFGGNSAGIILNNYSTLDTGASLCRFLMALSVIGGYPFLISACKVALLDVLDQFNNNNNNKVNSDEEKKESQLLLRRRRLETTVTRALVATLTAVALILPNAGFVISFNGALLGSIFCYVLPAMLFLSNTKGKASSMNSNDDDVTGTTRRQLRIERWFNYGLVVFGSVAGLAGGAVSILNAYFPQILR